MPERFVPKETSEIIIGRVIKGMKRIAESNSPQASMSAVNFYLEMEAGQMEMSYPRPETYSPATTAFDLIAIGAPDLHIYRPALVMNPEAVLAASDEQIDADLVRSLALAEEFGAGNFSESYSTVYDRAIQREVDWLDGFEPGPVLDPRFDPRTQDRETLKRTLLGDARYYNDVSIHEWDRAFDDEILKQLTGNHIGIFADRWKGDTELFIKSRHAFIPEIDTAQKVTIPDFYSYDPQKRLHLTGLSLLSRTIIWAIKRKQATGLN